MPKEAFWQNAKSIALFAVAGTLINAILIGGSLFYVYEWKLIQFSYMEIDITTAILFGSIIAAVDPVAVGLGWGRNLYLTSRRSLSSG